MDVRTERKMEENCRGREGEKDGKESERWDILLKESGGKWKKTKKKEEK